MDLYPLYHHRYVRYLTADLFALGFWSSFKRFSKQKGRPAEDDYVALIFYYHHAPIAHVFLGDPGDYSVDYDAFDDLPDPLRFEVERIIQTFSYTHIQFNDLLS